MYALLIVNISAVFLYNNKLFFKVIINQSVANSERPNMISIIGTSTVIRVSYLEIPTRVSVIS